jgi:hypothetical protein
MAKQTINIGTVANDGTGDSVRAGGDKINDNFTEVYTALGDGTNLNDVVTNTTFQSTLANTNTFINSQLANTNSFINSQLANTNSFINSQLANTNAYILSVNNSIAASASLGNTNSRIDLVNTNLTTTNTALRVLIDDRVQVANSDVRYAQLASNNDFTSTNQMRLGAPVKTTTANAYTLAITDAGFYHRLNFSGVTAVGVTIPANSAEAIPIGSEYMFIRTGSNTSIVFVPAGGVTLNSDGGKTRVQYQWQTVVCKKVGTNEWDLIGNLSI